VKLLSLFISISLSLNICLAQSETGGASGGVYPLTLISAQKVGMKSCYRWMTAREKKSWLKNKRPSFYSANPRDLFGRYGKTDLIYCWSNPVGSIMGTLGQEFGPELVRIDFVDDAVTFNRNKNAYTSLDRNQIPEELKKEINTEIVYSAYGNQVGELPWLHEYLLRSPKVIKGFTFNDAELRREFEHYYDLRNKKLLGRNEFYRPYNRCQIDTVESDARGLAFHRDPYKYHCQKFKELVDKRRSDLIKFWNENPQEEYFSNPEAR
jgi:hypothetical protein